MKAWEIDAIITACYAASIDATRWADTLDLIGKYYHASGAGIVFYDPARNPHTVHSSSLSEANQPYRDYWWQHDTRITRAKNARFRDGDVVCDGHIIAEDEKRRDPFFQEFGRAHGFDELMAYFAQDPFGGVMTVSVPRGAKGGAFDVDELDTWKIIGAHAAQAFTLTATLQQLRSQLFSLQDCLHQSITGVIALDCTGRVTDVSDMALRLMRDCIRVGPDRRLAAINPREQIKIDRILRDDPGNDPSAGGISRVIRSIDNDLRLFIQIFHVRPDERDVAPVCAGYAYKILTLRDFSARGRPSISHHLEQLGLTPAEARVAMMVGRGHSPTEAARELAVSLNTIRAQLKSIFGKLDINRQSELSAIVSRFDVLIGSGV